jgi:hypothetical protein
VTSLQRVEIGNITRHVDCVRRRDRGHHVTDTHPEVLTSDGPARSVAGASAGGERSGGPPPTARGTGSERLDREHEQLFHELRAIIPGAEVLFAFMLAVAFTERFHRLTDLQRWIYYLALLSAAGALLTLLAPASFHRVRFRQRDKEALMRVANVEAIASLVMISLSIAGTLFLITDLVFSTPAAIAVSATAWTLASMLWWGLPLLRKAQDD